MSFEPVSVLLCKTQWNQYVQNLLEVFNIDASRAVKAYSLFQKLQKAFSAPNRQDQPDQGVDSVGVFDMIK